MTLYCIRTNGGSFHSWSFQFGTLATTGATHLYRLYISCHPNGVVRFRLAHQNAMLSNDVLKANYFTLHSDITVGQLITLLINSGLERYSFLNQRGQRFWIDSFLSSLSVARLISPNRRMQAHNMLSQHHPIPFGTEGENNLIVPGQFWGRH